MQEVQRVPDLFNDLGRDLVAFGIHVSQLFPTNIIIMKPMSVDLSQESNQRGRESSRCKQGVSCIVVHFCELDDDLPTIVDFCGEHRFGTSRDRIRISFATEPDLTSRAVIGERCDVGKNLSTGEEIEIHLAVKRI